MEFQSKFGIQLGIPIQMGIDLRECNWISVEFYPGESTMKSNINETFENSCK